MNLIKFKDALLQNERAFYGVYNGVLNPKHGFMADYQDNDIVVPLEEFKRNTKRIIKNFVFDKSKMLTESFNYIGGFIYLGYVCLYITKQFVKESDAKDFANRNRDISIFDCKNGNQILAL